MTVFSRLRSPSSAVRLAALCCLAASALACGAGSQNLRPLLPLPTRVVEFQAAPGLNNGNPLSVDIIYITYAQQLREVTRLGPKGWFQAPKRGSWKLKESVLVEAGKNVVVKLDPLILERTVMLVIYADYKNSMNPADTQVIVDFAGKKKEIVKVTEKALEPVNPSLRYVK